MMDLECEIFGFELAHTYLFTMTNLGGEVLKPWFVVLGEKSSIHLPAGNSLEDVFAWREYEEAIIEVINNYGCEIMHISENGTNRFFVLTRMGFFISDTRYSKADIARIKIALCDLLVQELRNFCNCMSIEWQMPSWHKVKGQLKLDCVS